LSVKGICVELITRPEESYRLRCVVVGDLETPWSKRHCPTGGYSRFSSSLRGTSVYFLGWKISENFI